MDGKRYRMPILPGGQIPDGFGCPLRQPHQTSPYAWYHRISTGPANAVYGYLFDGIRGPHGEELAQETPAQVSRNVSISPSGRLISAARIGELAPNEVFVFGSNRHGQHGSGAAGAAVARFGAVYGQGRGLQGQSYAIITMTWPAFLAREVAEFCEFAARHPEMTFLVAEIGCHKAGYTPDVVAPMFARAPGNVALPASFAAVLDALPQAA